MRHLDEGQLHEWLDGEAEQLATSETEEHLASCTQCAGLLEQVKSVRDRAANILSASGPVDLGMPAFDEIRTRAKQQEESHKLLRYVRLKQLSWAATLALAVAVGWYARDRLSPTSPERIGETRYAPTSVPAPAGPEAGMAAQAESSVTGRLEQDVAREATRAENQPEDRESVAADEPLDVAAALVPEALERAELERPQDQPVQLAAEPGVQAQGAGAQTGDSARQKARGAAGDPAAIRYADAAPQPVARRVGAENTVTADRLAVTEGVEQREASEWYLWVTEWTVTDEPNAADILGGTLPVIDGLDALDYAVRSGSALSAVRIRYRIESGEIVELIVSPQPDRTMPTGLQGPAIDSLAREREVSNEESVNTVLGQLGEFRLAIRGTADVEVLRDLAARVRR